MTATLPTKFLSTVLTVLARGHQFCELVPNFWHAERDMCQKLGTGAIRYLQLQNTNTLCVQPPSCPSPHLCSLTSLSPQASISAPSPRGPHQLESPSSAAKVPTAPCCSPLVVRGTSLPVAGSTPAPVAAGGVEGISPGPVVADKPAVNRAVTKVVTGIPPPFAPEPPLLNPLIRWSPSA